MKKEEIKNAFEESLKNIKVSRKLKEKTLNNIYTKNNVYHFPYWLKNCAAIFIVTCICLSIYLINNKPQLQNESDKINLNNESINQETAGNVQTETISNSNSFMLKSSKPSLNYSAMESLQNASDSLREYGSILMDSLESQQSEVLTEEEFLIKNPDAKKSNEGYMIIENNEEVIYIFKNGLFIEKKD